MPMGMGDNVPIGSGENANKSMGKRGIVRTAVGLPPCYPRTTSPMTL